MRCAKPKKLRSGQRVPCGKCESCFSVRQGEISQRIKLELASHPFSRFVTLTFADEHLPRTRAELVRRIRVATRGNPYRLLLVTERGERGTHRVHLHLLAFGQPHEGAVEFWRSRWPFGNVDVQDGNSLWCPGYLSKYVVKQSGDADVMQFHPDGLGPNVLRFPRRPALGAVVVPRMVHRLLSSASARAQIALMHDVPSVHRMDGYTVRTPRAIVTRLRSAVGLPSSSSARTLVQEIRRSEAEADPLYSAKQERKRIVRAELDLITVRRGRARRTYADPGRVEAEKRFKAAVAAGTYVPRSVRLARARKERQRQRDAASAPPGR